VDCTQVKVQWARDVKRIRKTFQIGMTTFSKADRAAGNHTTAFVSGAGETNDSRWAATYFTAQRHINPTYANGLLYTVRRASVRAKKLINVKINRTTNTTKASDK
jgi:hypothetical protein